MAAVIGDFVSDSSHFQNMIANPSIQHQHSHDSSSSYRSASRPRHSATPRVQRPDSIVEYSNHANQPAAPSPSSATTTVPVSASASASAPATVPGGQRPAHVSVTGGASRFPSPPPSSSPSAATGPVAVDDGISSSMASDARDSVPLGNAPPSGRTATNAAQQPSPSSDDFQIPNPSLAFSSAGASQPTPQPEQTVIHIRDLAHIQSLASADLLSGNDSGSGILNDPPLQQMKYEISGMPIGDIIEMVAALLTKITTTNDLQHDAMQRNVAHQQQANQSSDTSGSPISPLNHSVLAFHGKNVPAITILSYLSRIHKYCPTTYEVFLSLLVYFDRMTERVNDMVMKSEEARRQTQTQGATPTASHDTHMHGGGSEDSDESDSDLADEDEEMEDHSSRPSRQSSNRGTSTPGDQSTLAAATYFVVDSFNIHRLIISGVTCASKFFSDVFYTNSRYAKVGGLPLVELNHLELQFLLLNDFRLAVPVEDLEAYATMLVEFYAREVVAKQPGAASGE
ncbi:cyclin-domain-containing protein [Dactylonectria estremocensis]|uniref:Cyclin-domain-containing protein n=1 Tax=Dactylonectria estremocensis TaxID=1079267 RepID=A0A9P9JFN4_9HYPO|nr:cyclin-domain-containing protein [Dactylonectria estremocensis]